MNQLLLDTARRFSESHADASGIAVTPIVGLRVVRLTRPRAFLPESDRPMICLVLQGRMKVSIGTRAIEAGAGESVLFTSDVPSVTEVCQASLLEPYIALLIELDAAVITSLVSEIHAVTTEGSPWRTENTDADVASVALRLMNLLRHPESMSLLIQPLFRELHYWLLTGKHGAAIKGLSKQDSAAQRVARAIALIRAEFAKSLPIDRLASRVGMSASAFHHHFRAVTAMTPLQFQKRLRLIESRRLMLSEGRSASSAAFTVGYQSVSQFNRDYRRMFGLPPVRETVQARKAAEPTLRDSRRSRGDALATAAG
ncbi:AraC family transcriptional regulator [Steroidobacter sp. S1-65]|uniref:AraC family transcriptional regulator n=1 Tax=Steroidobacter gossypii TaxID=2805490 RepID=A0ABS1X064_9GAMM|nr:AraC family transcriptional regulator [Steroidobacter gossypii]MBM0106625.1 AraC family transcriptional regulator [Steroidobacter gossypii]